MLHRKKTGAPRKERMTFYQKFGLFFFSHSRLTLLLWVFVLGFGALAYTTFMQREGFPSVAGPYSLVNGTYFVNDRERVDREISRPAAEAIMQLSEVKKVSSQAGNNFFGLQIEFQEAVNPEDGSRKVEEIIKSRNILPADAQAEFKPLFISKLTPEGDDLLIAVASNNLSPEALQAKAGEVSAALRSDGSNPIEGAQRVQPVDLFRRGVDPVTGEALAQQKSFDFIASKQGDAIEYRQSALVAVQAKEGVDILKLDAAAKESLAKLQQQPQFSDVSLTVAADFAETIRHQIDSLQKNLVEGLLVVVLVSFLFISLRASFVIALSMITVLLMTVGALYLFGFTLNTITLFALILSLGLIVDDTIIMAEAIDKGRRKGAKASEVVGTALKKVALASTAGTLATAMAFAPLLFISGIMGGFIRALPITIILSLAISLLISTTLIPFLARFTLLRGNAKESNNPIAKFESTAAAGLARVVRQVGRSRGRAVSLGLGAIGISLVMFFGGVFFFSKLEFNIFPPSKDSDAISVNLNFAPGSSIASAQQTSSDANRIISESIGQYVKRVSYQGSGTETQARAMVDLVSYKDREPTSKELSATLQASLVAAGINAEATADGGPAPTGAFTMQVRTEDAQKAQALATAIQQFLDGKELTRPNGTTAKVQDAEVNGLNSVLRAEGQRYFEVNADFSATDTSALFPLTQQAVKNEFTTERLERQFGLSGDVMKFDVGQEAQNQESFGSMLIAFPVLLLAMYLLLAVQFRSTSQPLIIFLAIPFSVFGVGAGLYYTNNSFSFFTMLAIFGLLGIAVNNTILLTDFANQARKRGLRRSEAIAEALEERFRPLVTTSLTSVVALIPLALTDPFWEALAVTLIFGLLSSTFLVIVAFPYYYLGNELIRSTFNRWRAIAWIATLIVGTIAVAQLIGTSAAQGFAAGYVLLSFAVLATRAVRRRRK